MQPTDIPPALLMLASALVMPLLRGWWLRGFALGLPVLALGWSWMAVSAGASMHLSLAGLVLQPVRVHAATPAFATIFCLMAGLGTLFALRTARRAELVAAMVYAGGALGVCFSGDLVSLLICLEIMLLGSAAIVWLGGQPGSRGAGLRYFIMHTLAGVLILVGVVLVMQSRIAVGDPSPLKFGALAALLAGHGPVAFAGAALVLAGILVCAGAPPFSPWVSDAYPEASSTGAVFLSAFTTKSAVFALIVAFAGLELLVWVGLFMALYGIVFAVLENDIRRVLAYSIVNQVGFMLVGVGIGTPLSIDGATAHAFAHIIYKALLMMTAGAVIAATGTRLLSGLGGLYRRMPVTLWCCIVGALAISAFPLTSGFTSKGMIDEAVALHAAGLTDAGAASARFVWAWLALEVASAGVFLHAGIKFPWFVFFNGETQTRAVDPPLHQRAAMVTLAALCIVLGVFPQPLYAMLPTGAASEIFWPHAYSLSHVVEMLCLLLFSGAAFFVLLPVLQRTRTVSLDSDWLWRRFPQLVLRDLMEPFISSWQPFITRAWRRAAVMARRVRAPKRMIAPAAVVLGVLILYLMFFFVLPAFSP